MGPSIRVQNLSIRLLENWLFNVCITNPLIHLQGEKGRTEIEDEANPEEASTRKNDENETNEKEKEANGDTVDDDEETELQFDDDVASQKSEDTIYPTESPFVAPDSPRAETPESEPEPEPEPEVRFKEGRKSKSGKNDKKWAWKRATSLMKWNDVQPGCYSSKLILYHHQLQMFHSGQRARW